MRSIKSSCVLAAFISLGFVGFITHSAREMSSISTKTTALGVAYRRAFRWYSHHHAGGNRC